MSSNFAPDYNTVAERLAEFKAKHPEGSLQPADPTDPLKLITIGDKTFLLYVACAYRTPEDPRPGIGVAWEPFPGRTNFTRDSEAQNAESSAWGRALVAALAADAKKEIASADEVRNRRAEQGFGNNPLEVVRNKLLDVAGKRGWDMDRLSAEFHGWSAGNEIREADEETLERYLKHLEPPKTAQRRPLKTVGGEPA